MSPEAFRRKVAARIQRARWRLGLTQADAAHRVGLTFRYFAEVERARRNPTLDVLLSIATALKVKVADLVDVQPGPCLDLDQLDLSPPPTGRKPTRVQREPLSQRRTESPKFLGRRIGASAKLCFRLVEHLTSLPDVAQ